MSETSIRIIRITGIILLSAIIVAAGIIAWLRYDPGEDILIVPADEIPRTGTIYIGGDVSLPGLYLFGEEDTVTDLVAAAGGLQGEEETAFSLTVKEAANQPQKIDINRAEAWLLRSLPGIGETLADRICAWRQEYGPFRNTLELLDVEGIGPAVYEKIEQFITVKDVSDR